MFDIQPILNHSENAKWQKNMQYACDSKFMTHKVILFDLQKPVITAYFPKP